MVGGGYESPRTHENSIYSETDVVVGVVAVAVAAGFPPTARRSKMDCWSGLMESCFFSSLEGEGRKG